MTRTTAALLAAAAALAGAAAATASRSTETATGYELRTGDQAFMRQAGMRCYLNGALANERQFLQSRVVAGCTPLGNPGGLRGGYIVRMSDRGVLVTKNGRVIFRSAVR
jgi:hypothetical protein